jgi:hypothetical protein
MRGSGSWPGSEEFAAGLKRSVRGPVNGAKVMIDIKKAGGAIAILSVIGDTYLSVYSFSGEGHHRQELQKWVNLQITDGLIIKMLTDEISAIRDLCARRFN